MGPEDAVSKNKPIQMNEKIKDQRLIDLIAAPSFPLCVSSHFSIYDPQPHPSLACFGTH